MEENYIDPLVVAVTRPAMRWGVTLEGIILSGGLVGILMIATGNPIVLLVYVPLHGAMYLACLKDPQIFRFFFLWLKTKAKSLGWRHWGASTSTPFINNVKKVWIK